MDAATLFVIVTMSDGPQTPAEGEKRKEIMTRSGWLIILVIVLVAAWFAYTRTHPAPLPNFHW